LGNIHWHRREHVLEDPFVPINPFQLHPLTPDVENLPPPSLYCLPISRARARTLLLSTLPRQAYLHLHLRLPSLYFTRLARIFADADLSRPDVQRLDSDAVHGPFRRSWELFVESLLREWKTLNVVSALLLS
jgi:hypothetical protein